MSTDKILVWGEDLDLERRLILGMCTKHVICLENPCTSRSWKEGVGLV